jgi:FAD/FMN-containing dehydrogenase
MMRSWGNLAFTAAREVVRLPSRSAGLPAGRPLLAWGNGRSYGDVCVNGGGTTIHTRNLDRFMAFDAASGRLRVESGVLLSEILDLVTPRGWFLPVTPGTRFVTVGGAIANDVHGKNHHREGTFGRHVVGFELLRSEGERLYCSATENPEMFAATIGGLGLTGLITWAEIDLRRISSLSIIQRQERFHGLRQFFDLNHQAELDSEHTVAWIDCLAAQPRGIMISGNHAENEDSSPQPARALNIPLTLPFSVVNRATLSAFNNAYFHRPLAQGPVPYGPFLYPLDGILHWNRLHGRAGFFQYQCVLPGGEAPLAEFLQTIAASGEGSFLAVLKTFGDVASPGMLSFPMPGSDLAFDFPNRGATTLRLFDRLDAIVAAAGGRLYAAKDARMPAALFRSGCPGLERFTQFVDPAFSSSFWRRVMEQQ